MTAEPLVLDAQRWRVIGLAIGLVALVGTGLSFAIPLLSLELERRGISSTLNGINTAMGGVGTIAIAPFVPGLARAFGLRPTLAAAILAASLSLLAMPLSPFPAWFPLRFIFGAGIGTMFVLSEYWITTSAPEQKRGLVMGVYGTVLATGFALGPVLMALFGSIGLLPYMVGAGLFLLAIIPLVWAGGSAPSLIEKPRTALLAVILAAPAATVAGFIFGAIETGGFALAPVYGLRIGLSEAQAALLVSALAIGNIVFQVPVGLLADKIDRMVILAACAALGLIGALLIPFLSHHFVSLIVGLVIWGGVVGTLYPVGLALLGSRFSSADLAQANAAFVILYSSGLIVGPAAIGAGMDALNPHGFAFSIAAFFALFLALLAALRLAGRA